jgi:autophagy-related protein 9
MASNILSRLLPSASQEDSRDTRATAVDLETGHPDTGHLDHDPHFEDQDLDQLLAEGIEDDAPTTDEVPASDDGHFPHRSMKRPTAKDTSTRSQMPPSRPLIPDNEDDEDDVPPSLLLGGRSDRRRRRKSTKLNKATEPAAIPVAGPESRATRAQWETTRAQQRLHNDLPTPPPVQAITTWRNSRTTFAVNRKEKAMWAWANVDNLDSHLDWVYRYYEQHGIWSHVLNKAFRYLTATFVFWLFTFMLSCIDYSKLRGSTKFEQIRVPQCYEKLPWYWNFFIWVFVLVLVFRFVQEIQNIPRWLEMHDFYKYLLDIPDKDIQTVSWQYVVSKLMELRDANPTTAQTISAANRRWMSTQSKQRMDAHDIANRLMRRDNYWIAMINKDIMDFGIDIPFLGKMDLYPYSLQWLISLCLMDCVFDDHYQVKENFRTTRNRKENIDLLQRRFRAAGVVSIPFVGPLAIISAIIRFLESYTVRGSIFLGFIHN